MKKAVHKIVAILMVTILMVSTTSFSIYKHFCGDNLVEVSRYETRSCCPSEEDEHSKKTSNELSFSEKECCKNETEISEPPTLDNSKNFKLIKNQLVFVTSFYYSFIEKNEDFDSKTNFYNNFSPPEIVLNKQVQFQSFLI